MRILLDTSAVLRWSSDRGIPAKASRILARSDTESFISIVTGWELVLKPVLNFTIEQALIGLEATLLPITLSHLTELSRLPHHHDHRDPFDRMLIAQALSEGLTVISSDARFSEYRGLKVLWD